MKGALAILMEMGLEGEGIKQRPGQVPEVG
jgi:hypothetical protein